MSDATVQLVVKVFLASPGGLDTEREIARRVVDEVNRDNAERWGVALKLVGWEETIGGNRRAQSDINKELDGCQYFIGLIWDHWGSTPYGSDDKPGPYSSGFEEEFERAKDHHETGRVKDLFLLLKDIPEDKLRDPGDSLKKVLLFIDRIRRDRKPLAASFGDATRFETLIRQRLMKIGWEAFDENRLADTNSTAVASLPAVAKKDKQLANQAESLFQPEAVKFLEVLIAKKNQYDDLSDVEVARARLLAKGLHRSANDREHLGVHDANLIYRDKDTLSLSAREMTQLAIAGVAHNDQQVAPLWYWLEQIEKEALEPNLGDTKSAFLILQATAGASGSRDNALHILRKLAVTEIGLDAFFDRPKVVTAWLSEEVTDSAFKAACEYLGSLGESGDIETIDGMKPHFVERRQEMLDSVVIEIEQAKNGPKAAWDALVDRNPNNLSAGAVQLLEGGLAGFETEVLLQALEVKDQTLVLSIVRELVQRRALPERITIDLLDHDNYELRYLAASTLSDLGKPRPDDEVRKILSKPVKRRDSWLGLFGLLGRPPDVTWWDKYLRDQRSSLPKQTLIDLATDMGADRDDYLEVLYAVYGKSLIDEMRDHLVDRYKKRFDDYHHHLTTILPADSDLPKRFESVREFTSKQLISSTLNSFCAVANGDYVSLVRELIDELDVPISEELIRYFGRYGAWEDIDRLLKLYREKTRTTLLMIGSDRPTDSMSQTLHRVGRHRLVDLIAKVDDHYLASAIFSRVTQKELKSMGDEWLLKQLDVENDSYRKMLSLRLCKSLPKSRLKNLVAKYFEGHHYYNVVHWLDLGISMPATTVKLVVDAELADLNKQF